MPQKAQRLISKAQISVPSVIKKVSEMPSYPHSDLTSKIIGLGIKVHKELGSAYEEKVYQRALYLELQRSGLKFEREKEIAVNYGKVRIGKKKLDFIVDGKIVVEIKKVDNIDNVHIAQVASYLKTLGLEIGLILNFGKSKLEIKRVKV
ncbi:MAG: GxxExxY protein [Parcubacteria group bacterium CG07_land_8_20_14_0_80_35_11]|nr:MAG: GxxExxY protein [Parcubacteria group bacterium CG07_land_8_20_14_0_80_35_11]